MASKGGRSCSGRGGSPRTCSSPAPTQSSDCLWTTALYVCVTSECPRCGVRAARRRPLPRASRADAGRSRLARPRALARLIGPCGSSGAHRPSARRTGRLPAGRSALGGCVRDQFGAVARSQLCGSTSTHRAPEKLSQAARAPRPRSSTGTEVEVVPLEWRFHQSVECGGDSRYVRVVASGSRLPRRTDAPALTLTDELRDDVGIGLAPADHVEDAYAYDACPEPRCELRDELFPRQLRPPVEVGRVGWTRLGDRPTAVRVDRSCRREHQELRGVDARVRRGARACRSRSRPRRAPAHRRRRG